MMKKNEKMAYKAPKMETVSFKAEQGYAASGVVTTSSFNLNVGTGTL